MGTYAERLSHFAAELEFGQLPEHVVEDAKLRFLDAIGICLASCKLEAVRALQKVVIKWGGSAESSVIGIASKVVAPGAALANGTAAHSLDYDDTHGLAKTHVSACIAPTTLAVAEMNEESGKNLIAGYVAGSEVMIRIGLVAPNGFNLRGFHNTGVCGAFAAALASGMIMRLDASSVADAMGIVGSMASGCMEFLQDGSWVKMMHPGWAAHSGIVASQMASHGFSGPHTILEGRFGLYNTYLSGASTDLDAMIKDLGEVYEVTRTSFKPYPSCHYNHAFIDAAIKLRERYFPSLEDVERIECGVTEETVPIVCEPREMKVAPLTPYGAKFSLQFSVAAALLQGAVDLDTYAQQNIHEPTILSLAKKVGYFVDDELSHDCFPGRLKIVLSDGKAFQHTEYINRGHPLNPMSRGQIIGKFMANASRLLPEDRVEDILSMVMRLDRLSNVGELMELCTA